MKALLYTGPHTVEWRDQPEPTPGNDEVVVRVDAVGICGSGKLPGGCGGTDEILQH